MKLELTEVSKLCRRVKSPSLIKMIERVGVCRIDGPFVSVFVLSL